MVEERGGGNIVVVEEMEVMEVESEVGGRMVIVVEERRVVREVEEIDVESEVEAER